ncbi:MAG TPA: hypothetical protein DEA08_25320 [Planctomycetes bacterium]|mgnify:CR=1 FL=1|nr:hypothetical protein [Planctomycetota bacterium]
MNCPTCTREIPARSPEGLCPRCLLDGPGLAHSFLSGEPAEPAPPPDELAALFPDFELGELLGEGGMGRVYAARDLRLGRRVALKLLREELAEDPAFVERFEREARTLAQLSEPFAVALYDFGQAGPYPYLVLEHIEGRTLREAFAEELPHATLLLAVARVAEVLARAHAQGIVHRDVKPANVLLDRFDCPRLTDFGLAKLVEGGQHSLLPTLTRQHQVLGSLCYLAPELQLQGAGAASPATDVYALGVVLYEALTGSLPLGRFPAPSETPGVDATLDELVFACLERDPAARPSASEVQAALEAWLARPEPALRRAARGARDVSARALTGAREVGGRAVRGAADASAQARRTFPWPLASEREVRRNGAQQLGLGLVALLVALSTLRVEEVGFGLLAAAPLIVTQGLLLAIERARVGLVGSPWALALPLIALVIVLATGLFPRFHDLIPLSIVLLLFPLASLGLGVRVWGTPRALVARSEPPEEADEPQVG